jgi:rubrerythrin
VKTKRVEELILQSLEHELGGVKIYELALACAQNADLKEEWEKYLDQTRTHVQMLEEICGAMKIDPKRETAGRRVVRAVGQGLLEAMRLAKSGGDPEAAEIVACEAVVLAETKDHLDWEVLGKCAEHLPGTKADTLKSACQTVEEQEDEHLYDTKGWCREMWLGSLGLEAILPPPEERKHVRTAISAARAEKAAEKGR